LPIDPMPRRSEDELLALVRQKAAVLRQRRLAALGAAAAILLLFASGVALAGTTGGTKRTLRTAGPAPTATTSVAAQETTSSSSVPTTAAPTSSSTVSTTTSTTAVAPTHWRTVVGGSWIEVTVTPPRPVAGALAVFDVKAHIESADGPPPEIQFGDGSQYQQATLSCDVVTIGPDGKAQQPPKNPSAGPMDYHFTVRHAYRAPVSYRVKVNGFDDCRGHVAIESDGDVHVLSGTARSNGPDAPSATVFWHNVQGENDAFTKHATASGTDDDGFVRQMTLDWGDGSPPDVVTFTNCVDEPTSWPYATGSPDRTQNTAEFSHHYASAGTYSIRATVNSAGCNGADRQEARSEPADLAVPGP